LILFGDHAYLNSPLTLDTVAVGKLLNNSLSGMAGDATAIGDAIGLAVRNLRDRPAKSRAIILLTDGEDNSSSIPPLQAAALAKQYGIRIYTIVVGREGRVPFPDGHGGIAIVDSSIDTKLTRQIAEITHGKFYTAVDQRSLSGIYDEIDALEKSDFTAQTVLIRTPLFQYPLAVGLILLFALAMIGQSRRDSHELSAI
jgi:Ca-activated chloride channel family protein